jgi:hypothetical protein
MRAAILFFVGLTCAAGAARTAAADPIYLRAGQCIIVGTQQVCAMAADVPVDSKQQILYVCRYGMMPGAELSDLKSYALFQVQVNGQTGAKSETIVKNYGPNDKEICEKEAEKRQAAVK